MYGGIVNLGRAENTLFATGIWFFSLPAFHTNYTVKAELS